MPRRKLTKRPSEIDIQAALAGLLGEAGRVTSGTFGARLGISRQAAHVHLRRLAEAGALVARGGGRGAHFVAPEWRRTYRVTTSGRKIDEERVWADVEQALVSLDDLTDEARARAHYVVTEIVNNAIDHADARTIEVVVRRALGTADEIEIVVDDDGVGAIARAGETLDVARPEEVIVELSKGKHTTMPARHSGEGLFFTSKAARSFVLEANGLAWIVEPGVDEGIAVSDVTTGTRVTLRLDPRTRTPLEEVFARFTIDFAFAKTRPRVSLLDYGDRLISRSQAKRLCARLESFAEVELDFEGVKGVGQGFVDEVFRVFADAHPQTTLVPVRMNGPVEFMVSRGRRTERA